MMAVHKERKAKLDLEEQKKSPDDNVKIQNLSKIIIFDKIKSYRYNQDAPPKFGIGLSNDKFVLMPFENAETVYPNPKFHYVDQRKPEKLPEHQEEIKDIINKQEVNEASAGIENEENYEMTELNEPKQDAKGFLDAENAAEAADIKQLEENFARATTCQSNSWW